MRKTKKKLEILKRLEKMIDEAHVSQAGIARQMGTSPALISRWKRGDITPTLESYDKLCKILNSDVNWLLTGQVSGSTAQFKSLTEEESMYRIKYEEKCEEVIKLQKIIIDAGLSKKARPLAKNKSA